MADESPAANESFLERRIDSKGLRPRVAASVIAVLWLVAIAVFGLLMHLLDGETFTTFWDGAWWATQTVTTVGYGDIVPGDGLGRFVGGVLMIGGLSFFAVVTGWITTEFVTRAQATRHESATQELAPRLDAIQSQLAEIREQLGALSPEPGPAAAPPPGDRPPQAG